MIFWNELRIIALNFLWMNNFKAIIESFFPFDKDVYFVIIWIQKKVNSPLINFPALLSKLLLQENLQSPLYLGSLINSNK